MIVARSLLWFCHGSSDKVYRAEVTQNPNGSYTLTAFWGRRGKSMQSQIKGVYGSHWMVMQAFHGLVASKTVKGYRQVESVPA